MRTTVLIANYNYGRYIEQAINSCLRQTVKPNAICIVDDNSTDNSWEIISNYCGNKQTEDQRLNTGDGEIRLKVGSLYGIDVIGIKLPNTYGPSSARNTGIQCTIASTDVYAILDADDEMLPNKLEECLRPFEDERIGVVYANYFNINEETGVSLLEIKEPYDVTRLYKECIVHSGSLIRSSLFSKIAQDGNVYDPVLRTCEDWDLWLRLSNVCMFYHIPIPLTKVLVHQKNSTNSVPNEVWQQNWRYIAQKHFGV